MGRISKPGLRKYAPARDLPRIINGLGIAVISTSKGLMTDKQARRDNVGGEKYFVTFTRSNYYQIF